MAPSELIQCDCNAWGQFRGESPGNGVKPKDALLCLLTWMLPSLSVALPDSTIIIPISQMRKLKLAEARHGQLGLGHNLHLMPESPAFCLTTHRGTPSPTALGQSRSTLWPGIQSLCSASHMSPSHVISEKPSSTLPHLTTQFLLPTHCCLPATSPPTVTVPEAPVPTIGPGLRDVHESVKRPLSRRPS